MQVAASVLGPLLETVKPLDPDMKGAKLSTFCMHAPIAHVRHQVGDDRVDVSSISDDNMEGHVRGVGRFLYNHGGNSSHAAMFSDLVGTQNAARNFRTRRSHPSSLIFMNVIRLCKCWRWLGDSGPADFTAIRNLARDDPDLHVAELRGGAELVITLPLHDQVRANGERRRTLAGKPRLGKKESLRRGLRVKQEEIVACYCGALSHKCKSPIMQLLPDAWAAKERENAAPHTVGGAPARAGAVVAGSTAPPSACGTPPDGRIFAYGSGSMISSTSTAGDAPESGNPGTSSSKARRLATIASMPPMVPPRWILALMFPTSNFFDTVITEARDKDVEPQTDALRVAVISKHVAVVKLFLLRTKTYAFAVWMANSKLHWQNIIEASDALLQRLTASLDKLTPTPPEAFSPLLPL